MTQLESAGSPHDGVARYIRHLYEGGTGELPGGIPEDAGVYLRLAGARRADAEVAFPFEHLAEIAIKARLTGGLSIYEEAVFRHFEASDGTEGGLASELIRIAEGGTENGVDERLNEPIRAYLTQLISMVDQRVKSMVVLRAAGGAALRARRGEAELQPSDRELLEAMFAIDDANSATLTFLQGLANPAVPSIPEVPADLPSEMQEFLIELRILAVLGRERLDFRELTNSVLSARLHGRDLPQESQAVLAAFAESGEPYSRVTEFLAELAVPGTAPRLPQDLRRELFGELAGARREAYTLDRTVIGVCRVGTRVAPMAAG